MRKTLVITLILVTINMYAGHNLTELCNNFNTLNTQIRDSKITKPEALKQIQILLPQIKTAYYEAEGKNHSESKTVFPVENYSPKSIGGKNGDGYIPSKYDFFAGNKHTGHPAQDIFIRDTNQDCMDDKTKQLVNILSVSGGIVVAANSEWTQNSQLRGGNYIWIFDPYLNSLFYYAHNSEIFVKPGNLVKPGDKIALMGRTGLNAFKTRSPTHLHFMQLKLKESGYPKPIDCYQLLVNANTKR